MSVTFGPFTFATHHLIFFISCATAFLLGWLLSRRQAYGMGDILFRIIAVGLISARLVFVIKYYDVYLSAPWQLINIRDGGFSLSTGIIAGILWTGWELYRLPQAKLRLATAALSGLFVAVVLTNVSQYYQQQTGLPALALTNLEGHARELPADFAGQPLVINLWASWCPPCVREMPLLEQASTDWPEVAFITVNQGEGSGTVEQFLQQQQLTLPHVLLDANAELGQAVGSHALPTTLFLHSDGRVSYTHIGEFNTATLENALRRLE
ncbi:TlpA disulfide reductase family protein [Aliidiomarina soli]|uniref:Thioredoxin domain-containing protein n=1 Tax=Aliidiomarina soli TaxID=1928574 RepID=A0A432WFV5_9GAMM|nr:TlpA disulfide reductase family protein [Aliidiomarina soli]RUO32579.1 hypothetical protein CWE14_10595 [Aliidiomarina soli]